MDLEYTVSHISYAPPFQSPHFFDKMLKSNILYDHVLIDIYLFDDIDKISKSLCNVKGNFFTKMLVQPERLYFLFALCARNYPW